MTGTAGERFCTSCGEGVTAKFCAHCGTAVAPVAEGEGWSSLVGDAIGNAPPQSVLGVALSFARAPVSTAIRLANDTSYGGHWLFLASSLTVYFTVFELFIPRFVGRLQNITVGRDKWDFIAFQILTFAGILIMTPLLYYACRAISGRQPTPRAYIKLATLGFGYWYLLLTALILCVIVSGVFAGVVLTWLGHRDLFDSLTPALKVAGFCVYEGTVVWVFAAFHRRFWALSGWVTALLTLGYVAVSQGIVIRALIYAAQTANLAGWLRGLLG